MHRLGTIVVVALFVGCSTAPTGNPFETLTSTATVSTTDPTEGGESSDDGADEGTTTTGADPTTETTATTTLDESSSGAVDESSTTEPAVCGDGIIGPGETCDGEEFGDESCMSQGFGGGELVCNAGCGGFSTDGCFDCGDGEVQGTEQCDGAVPGGVTCESEGFTEGTIACDSARCQYDTSGCSLCGNGIAEADEPCDGDDLLGETCVTLGFDGGDLACQAANCSYAFDGCTGTNLVCAELVIGNASPQTVMDTTVGEDDDFAQSCGGGADLLMAFIAPDDGTYTFDAIGSDYDTLISVHADCDGTELGCNDDFFGNPDCGGWPCSQLDVNLVAGQAVVVAMSGFGGDTGNFTLNISGP
jgi:hypothetical protein